MCLILICQIMVHEVLKHPLYMVSSVKFPIEIYCEKNFYMLFSQDFSQDSMIEYITII